MSERKSAHILAFEEWADKAYPGWRNTTETLNAPMRDAYLAGIQHITDMAYGYLVRNVIEPRGLTPLPTLMGVCTQVDNITCYLEKERT